VPSWPPAPGVAGVVVGSDGGTFVPVEPTSGIAPVPVPVPVVDTATGSGELARVDVSTAPPTIPSTAAAAAIPRAAFTDRPRRSTVSWVGRVGLRRGRCRAPADWAADWAAAHGGADGWGARGARGAR
jgi:hypothetical protein